MLTELDRYILACYRSGMQYKTIARLLDRSPRCIESYGLQAIKKLEAKAMPQGVARAIGLKLISGLDADYKVANPDLDATKEQALAYLATKISAAHKAFLDSRKKSDKVIDQASLKFTRALANLASR